GEQEAFLTHKGDPTGRPAELPPVPPTRPPDAELRKLKADGKSQEEIAKVYDVSQTTGSRWYKEANIPWRQTIYDRYDEKGARALYEKHNGDKTLMAKEAGVDPKTITNMLKRYRIP